MELNRDDQKREVKQHGTYGFPIYIGRKWISSYPTGYFPWHWHDEVEFTLVVSGQLEYRVNDFHCLLTAGQGLFCNSGALHFGSMAGIDCDYISITVHPRLLAGFEGSAAGAKYVLPIVESSALPSLVLRKETIWQKEILASLKRLYRICTQKAGLYELYAQRLLLGIWIRLYEHCACQVQDVPTEDPEKLRRLRVILAFLHSYYAQKLTLEDVAREVGLSKSECCRFFKKQMGMPLFDYLTDYRVGKSLAVLQEGGSVAQAAAAVGFSDPSYYAKVFRARTGRSPSGYRKEATNQEVEGL